MVEGIILILTWFQPGDMSVGIAVNRFNGFRDS